MRVLQVNKFLYPVGGSETVLFETADLLQRNGHQVFFFGMKDERNTVDAGRAAFVSNVDLQDARGFREVLRRRRWETAGRFLYSREAAEAMERWVCEVRPDVAHLHNIYHQISPSILGVLRKHGVPVVMTLHDYKLICPNYTLYTNGATCERCKGHRFYEAVLHSCVKGSRLKSTLCALEAYAHNATSVYADGIDAYVAPSRFMAAKVVEFGVDSRRVTHVPNFVTLEDAEVPSSDGDYFVYAGRLEAVKGIGTLLKAVAASDIARRFELRVAGDGGEGASLAGWCRVRGLSNVRFLGRLSRPEVASLLGGARFVVLPSEWYENAPVSLLEAYARGRPVVASRIGGIPEVVIEGETGLLFEPGNAHDLRCKIEHLLAHAGLTRAMGKNARKLVETAYGPENHYRLLKDVYARAIESRGARVRREQGRTAL